MLLRAAIVMLVMLNLGAAGWWLLQPSPTAPVPAIGPSLHLLREAKPPAVAGKPQGKIDAPAAAAPEDGVSAAAAKPAPADSAPEVAQHCLRFGPFGAPAQRSTAAKKLSAAGLQPVGHDSPARPASGWTVYLPAQTSAEAAQALAEKLKADGIADLYVLTQGDAANSIALGRFSSEAGARRRQEGLQGKGIAAQIAPIGGTAAQYWLDARLPPDADRAALAKLAPAQALDCARLR